MDPTDFKIRLIRLSMDLIIEDINRLCARVSQWREEDGTSAELSFALDQARFSAMLKIQTAAMSAAIKP